MNIDFGQRECEFCKRYTLTVRRRCDHGVHLLLTLATGGLWLGVWALAWAFGPGPRCTQCGVEKPLMRSWLVLGPALAASSLVLLVLLRVATSPQYRQRVIESPRQLFRPFQSVEIERPR